MSGLARAQVTAADVDALTAVLKSFVRSCPEHHSVGSAIWALSKLNDDSLAAFFVEQIRLHYQERRLHPVQQADYALCRLGHDLPKYEYAPGERTNEGYWSAVENFLRRHPKT